MRNKTLTTGNIVPVISYFSDNFSIDEESNRLQVLHTLHNGADAIFSLGSTGEALFLKSKETIPGKLRAELVLIQMDSLLHYLNQNNKQNKNNYNGNSRKLIPFLLGAYGESPEECVNDLYNVINQAELIFKESSERFLEISKRLTDENIKFSLLFESLLSGIVIPPPKNTLLNEKALSQFYSSILDNVKFPVYLYNNPSTFGNNNITPNIISELILKHENLFGIKDSSNALENKIAYCQFLSENFSVSCGKEGMVGDFLLSINKDLRKYAGIVPSIGNLTNTPSLIIHNALKGNDAKVKELQDFMNSYRGNIYDSKVPKGKAQRGLKRAFRQIYVTNTRKIEDVPITVSKEFERKIARETLNLMEKTVNECLNMGVIKIYSEQKMIKIGNIKLTKAQLSNLLKSNKVIEEFDEIIKITGPFDGKINSIYLIETHSGNKLVFRARISKAFRYESIIKEKILFPFLDGILDKNTPDLSDRIKELVNKKKGSYIFKNKSKFPVQIQDLLFYDETKEELPYIYAIYRYIPGTSLYYFLEDIKNKNPELTNSKNVLEIFKKLGNLLGVLHKIEFDGFYSDIREIGDKTKKKIWSELFLEQWKKEVTEASAYSSMKPLLPKLEKYIAQNLDVIKNENRPVLFHNDFQSQNLIIEIENNENSDSQSKRLRSVRLIGLIDFDNWRIGPAAQDFVKMQYWTIGNNIKWNESFFKGYKEIHPSIDEIEFQNKINIYKILWFILVFNFEMDKVKKQELNEEVDKRFPSAEKYLTEIKKILE